MRDDTLELIRRLIAFPTISADGNAELIAFVCDYLAEWPARVQLFRHPHEPKANLLATFGPEGVPGLMLSGHSDVVPVAGQAWSRDPFDAWIDGARLYGRGACDMKGFLGLMLAAAPTMASADLRRPIHLAISYDEEVGCSGVRSLVDHLSGLAVKPAFCLVGEPTDMRITTGHKGILAVRTAFTGRPAHSSNPEAGASAAMAAARFALWLDTLAARLREAECDVGFTPPYTTVNLGRMLAGEAVNIVAEHAELIWEVRPIPATDPQPLIDEARRHAEALVATLKPQAPDACMAFDILAEAPALTPLNDNPGETLLKRLLATNTTNRVAFATEAGLFQQRAGIPALVCGPGSIEQAHTADEFVTLDQLDQAADLIDRLIDWACAPV
ncbi:MAG: acetylornithine deacetylase [Rhodothalassiaceae bacterium]